MFHKVLIANRGEIAIRIARTCRAMGLKTVAIYSEADADAPHVHAADEAVCVGPARSVDSYLNIPNIIAAALETGADAVHPGFGFLSERAAFAESVAMAGLTFVGPPAAAVTAMGDKTHARALVIAAGVPVVPALEELPADPGAIAQAAEAIGFPLLIKAAAGGGGKGMRIVRGVEELPNSMESAQREAQSAFGDGRVFLERYVERPRHIEVQVLADRHGNIIHLGERECSIQRRHQKIIEESPSPAVDGVLRRRITAAALQAARTINYVNAGTVENLLAPDGQFYFLEMNTRLQVEHPVTEWVYGLDLVQEQLRIAKGEALWLRQEDVQARGHSIECRVYAENPAMNFVPSPGHISRVVEPQGPGVRVDSGIRSDYAVPMYYDPMLSKVSTWGPDRDTARRRMIVALREYVIEGITTNIPFLIDLLEHPAFIAGHTHTHFIADHFPKWPPDRSA
ncbi:MAG: acetyl-CoA carboxylase biotin carboxylase subunit [Candidatus Binatia bacterium]